uniref:Uncharacterized protein n=1 Tax=Anguilla anguilla TaxID=7936 RepID=A0A0E9QVW7_ANGAN
MKRSRSVRRNGLEFLQPLGKSDRQL